MNKIEKLKNLLLDLFHEKAAAYDQDAESILEFILEADYATLYQTLVRDMEIVFACRAVGMGKDQPQYYGQKLFDQAAVLLYRDTDCSCDLSEDLETRHYWELWLLDDMTLAVTSCFVMIHDDINYCMEYREHKGTDWPDDIMEIDLEFLFDDLMLFREADIENDAFVYIES